MQDNQLPWSPGLTGESAFGSPRIWRRMASPCSSDRATSSRGEGLGNVLVNNAGTKALLPLLRGAPAPRIVNIVSSGGSLTVSSDPANPRRARFGTCAVSETALNALTVAFAADLESVGIK